jgi:hypothetical protein
MRHTYSLNKHPLLVNVNILVKLNIEKIHDLS